MREGDLSILESCRILKTLCSWSNWGPMLSCQYVGMPLEGLLKRVPLVGEGYAILSKRPPRLFLTVRSKAAPTFILPVDLNWLAVFALSILEEVKSEFMFLD